MFVKIKKFREAYRAEQESNNKYNIFDDNPFNLDEYDEPNVSGIPSYWVGWGNKIDVYKKRNIERRVLHRSYI